jgi:uncharacterized protein
LIQPIFNAPLLLVEGKQRILVAADLHLGLEYELWLGGVCIPSQTEIILKRLLGYLAEIKPDRLLLLGDIKHNIPRSSWQEKKEVPDFLRRLSDAIKVEIVPGNHDGNLADMAPQGVQVHSSTGFVLDGVGYFHGHAWPDKRIIKADQIVAGHLHPSVRLRDLLTNSLSYPVWARAHFLPKIIEEHYGFVSNAEMIIMPAFNHLCGGLPLNDSCDDLRGPLLTMSDLDRMRLNLLDGTDLGLLGDVKASYQRRTGQ